MWGLGFPPISPTDHLWEGGRVTRPHFSDSKGWDRTKRDMAGQRNTYAVSCKTPDLTDMRAPCNLTEFNRICKCFLKRRDLLHHHYLLQQQRLIQENRYTEFYQLPGDIFCLHRVDNKAATADRRLGTQWKACIQVSVVPRTVCATLKESPSFS